MSKIDPKTRKILDFVKDWLWAVPNGKLKDIAKACKVDGGTLSRIKRNPNYHPGIGTVLRILAEITGKFPLEIKDNILLSKLPSHGKGKMECRLSRGMEGLRESDIDLVFEFLAILKNRDMFDPEDFGILTRYMSRLQKELIKKKGPEVFVNPITIEEEGIGDELN